MTLTIRNYHEESIKIYSQEVGSDLFPVVQTPLTNFLSCGTPIDKPFGEKIENVG